MTEFHAADKFDERAFEEDASEYRAHVAWWAWIQVGCALLSWGAVIGAVMLVVGCGPAIETAVDLGIALTSHHEKP